MATGIVSQVTLLDGADALAGVLLVIAEAGYVLLLVAYCLRLTKYRAEFAADARNSRQAFGYFSFAAASNVLADRLAVDGHTAAAIALLTVGAVSWLALGCILPLLVAGQPGALAGANGTWLLWAVGAQSVSVAITALPQPLPAGAAAIAAGAWAVGVLLYLIIAVVVVVAVLTEPAPPGELTPAYWVFMGATAISVLAGARLLTLRPDPFDAGIRSLASGLSLALWAFGTWLIPLLLAAGIWRHWVRRFPLSYEPGLWSLAFPVAMYGLGSRELGAVLGVDWLVWLGRDEAWLALAVWAAVATAMTASWWRRSRSP